MIEADGIRDAVADGIRDAVAAAARALDADDADAATGHFIDSWTGPGSWAATPQTRRPAIVASVRNVRHWAHALMTESTPISAFGAHLRSSRRVSARGGGRCLGQEFDEGRSTTQPSTHRSLMRICRSNQRARDTLR